MTTASWRIVLSSDPKEEGSRKLYSLVNDPPSVNLEDMGDYEDWPYSRLMLVLLVHIYVEADYYEIKYLQVAVSHDFLGLHSTICSGIPRSFKTPYLSASARLALTKTNGVCGKLWLTSTQ